MTERGASDEIVFRMVLDSSDLAHLMGMGPGVMAGAAAGAGGAFPAQGQGLPAQQPSEGEGTKVKQDPSFKSIFKPLAALSIMEKTLGGILKHSQVAGAYLGAMGKMFGAAMDMLMLPLMPLFNLLMVAMSKLLQWLVTSGILEKLHAIFQKVAENIQAMVNWGAQMYRAIKEFDVGKAMSLGFKGLRAVIVEAIKNPLESIATIATMFVGAKMLGKVAGMAGLRFGSTAAAGAAGSAGGGLMAGMGRMGMAGLGGLGALAGGGAMTGAAVAGAGIGGAALGYYGWTQAGKKGGAGWMGVGEMAAGGALLGGAVGSVVPGVGTALGAGVGGAIGGGVGLAKKFGIFGGGGDEQAGGQNLENVGNTINVEINIEGADFDSEEVVSAALEQLEQVAADNGYELQMRSG